MRRLLSAAIVATILLMVCPASADSPTTVLNAVQNQGNTAGQAAVGTSGNTNQNNNQNSLGTSSATAVNIGGINITPSTTGGVSGLNGAQSGTGTGDGYVGYSGSTTFASPSVTFGNSKNINVNLPGLPGVLGAPGNFSQPYKPDVFINGAGPIRPARMTYEQAQECRGGYGYKDTYVGANREKAKEIQLVYAAWDKIDISNDISNYVGISSVEGSDKPWLPAVCEAAYHAMDRGANYGVVEFIIRPKNTMKGFGFGTSGGGSVVPSVATATSPYGLAASLGFGLGWSSQRVEGEVMIQVTGLRVPTQTSAVKPPAPTAPQVPVAPAAPTPPPAPAAAAPPVPTPTPPVPQAPTPQMPAESPRVIKPDGQTLKLQPEGRPQSNPDGLQGDPQPLSVPGQPQDAQGQAASVPDQSSVPLGVPGQPGASAPPQDAPSQAPVPLSVPGQPSASTPPQAAPSQASVPLSVPGQPSASAPPQAAPSQAPVPLSVPGQPSASAPPQAAPSQAPTPLSVPGQPTTFAPPQGNTTAIPASFLAPTGQPQGIQSKLNGAGGR
jgi:hypothetical protein